MPDIIVVKPLETMVQLTEREARIQERAPTVEAIKHAYKMRQDMIRTQTALTNQIRSICRRAANDGVRDFKEIKKEGGVIYERITKKKFEFESLDLRDRLVLETAMYLLQAREILTPKIKECEKSLAELAMTFTHMHEFLSSTKGVSYMTIATLIGEAGDLENYSNPAKLWKRCGVAVINGEAQRRIAGKTTEAKIKAVEHGYNPVRRSAVWNIVDSLLKQKNIYKPIYDAKKAEYYQTRTHLLKFNKEGEVTKGKGHLHNMAARYTTKIVLKHIWQVWRNDAVSNEYIRQEDTDIACIDERIAV